MYAKVFSQILDSSISRNYLTRLVFMDCLLLADEGGILDITADAIARRTNIPLDIVLEAIRSLSEPDPDSRSGAEEGRRLVLLDPHRNWGWRIVNHAKYRVIKTREDKRTYDQNRYAQTKKRVNPSAVNDSIKFHSRSQNSTDSTHSDSDVDVLNTCSPGGERQPVLPSMEAPRAANWGPSEKAQAFADGFWPAWPRKVARAAAEKAWLARATTPELADRIIEAAKVQTPQLIRNGLEFCPHPASWLNGKRFEDSPEAIANTNSGNGGYLDPYTRG
jgi:hypothetical protein